MSPRATRRELPAVFRGVELFAQCAEPDATSAEVDEYVGEVVQGPTYVDEAADDEGAAGQDRGDGTAELEPVGANGDLLVAEHGGPAGGRELGADGRGRRR